MDRMIRLFKNYYSDPDPARNAELEEVRRRDESIPIIGELVVMDGRPTFAEMFRRVNEETQLDDINVFANADCYFDESIEAAAGMGADEAYALLRWEDVEGGPKLYCHDDGRPHDDSQDAFIFRGPIRQRLVDRANFTMGIAGADNRLAAEMSAAGYRMSNPALDIRCLHLHRVDVRRYSKRREDAVQKPYLLIAPGKLGEATKTRRIR
jgi:hypothetical protein